jgi:phosphate-selective porin OprO/OprP
MVRGRRRIEASRFGARRLLIATLAGWLCVGGSSSATADDEKPSGYDRLWSRVELYEGDDESFFQSFALSGRLQLDWAYTRSDDSSHDEFNVRRFRFGFKTLFARELTLHVEGEFDPQEADPVYTRLTDAYLAWKPSDLVKATLGKHSAGFTLEGMTSSKRLLTIDRSNLTNNIWFTTEYFPGLSLSGAAGSWSYFAGIFSSGSETPEYGDFEGDEFVLLTLGHDFAREDRADEALLRLNLVHNDPDVNNDWTADLENIASLTFVYERDGRGVQTDISVAEGYFDQPDLRGFVVMPWVRLEENWELVGRYTFVDSAEDNGIRFARYERSNVDGRGDRYNEIYLGLNYYWYGHKLKLQNAIQYVDMRDQAGDGGEYAGFSWTTAFRLSW